MRDAFKLAIHLTTARRQSLLPTEEVVDAKDMTMAKDFDLADAVMASVFALAKTCDHEK